MEKVIDLNQTIHQLCQQFPEIADILYDLGFVEIVKPAMMATVGRFMTLQAGASLRKIDIEIIKETLITHGFTILEEEHE